MLRSRRLWIAVIAVLLWTVSAVPALADSGGTSLIGQDYNLAAGELAYGSVAVLGGSAEIASGAVLDGDLAIISGSARVAGTVTGELVVMGGTVVLEETAVIEGDVVTMGALDRHPGAQVRGNVVVGAEAAQRWSTLPGILQGEVGTWRAPRVDTESSAFLRGLLGMLRWLGSVLGLLFVGFITSMVLPDAMEHISRVMKQSPLLCIAMGIFTMVAMAIVIPILTIIIIGIPVAMVLGVALVLAGLVGWVAAARMVGQRILSAAPRRELVEMAVGIVALSLLGRVPCIGWLVTLLAISWGLGGVILTRFGTSAGQIWGPFVPLAGTQAEPSAPRAATRPAADIPSSEGATPSDGHHRDGDTRPLDDSDLDGELSRYTDD